MQGDARSPEEGRPEVVGAGLSDDPVFHPEPVRIPFAHPAPPSGSFLGGASSVVLVSAALLWAAAALTHPEPLPVAGAGLFGLLATVDLGARLIKSV